MKQLGRAVPLLVCRPPFSLLVAALYSLLSISLLFSLSLFCLFLFLSVSASHNSVAYTLSSSTTSSLSYSSVSSSLSFSSSLLFSSDFILLRPPPPRPSRHVRTAAHVALRTYTCTRILLSVVRFAADASANRQSARETILFRLCHEENKRER